MNRQEALKFIRDNSRVVRMTILNPTPKNERDDDYEENYSEQRIGNNGNIFIVNDYGRHGWELYFPVGSINIDKSIEKFCEHTGATTS